MRYEDFTLLFVAGEDSVYSVRVLDSPAGQGMGHFSMPSFGGSSAFRGTRPGVYRHLTFPKPEESQLSPEAIGSVLFDSLFKGEVAQLLFQSLGYVAATENCGLRLKLRLNPREPDIAKIYTLPWEFLYRTDTRSFIALDRRTSIVRYLDAPLPAAAMPLPNILRVLIVLPSPQDFPPLDLNRERAVIETAFKRVDRKLDVTFLERATPAALRSALLDKPYHILHFSGHGEMDRESKQSYLIFEDEDGNPYPLDSASLAGILTASPSLRLALINACDTATMSEMEGFSGIAGSLVLCGIPAVVAIHAVITDRAAIAFSESFYNLLAGGASLDEAILEGRMAIRQVGTNPWEWGTPALFSRLPANELFGGRLTDATSSPLRSAAYESIASIAKEIGKEAESRSAEQSVSVAPASENGLRYVQYYDAFGPVRESVQFVLRELEAGHKQARSEAAKWSAMSLVVAGLGLGLIIIGVIMLVMGQTDAGKISSMSSVIPTVISALFFSQSRIANRRMDANLGQLAAVRDIHFAAEIAASVANEEECNRLKEMIVKRILERGNGDVS